MSKRQVFIVSPIGEAGTETRKRADQVLKHVIIPSMVDYGFKQEEVVRADTISNPGAITHQITSAIINADLVIADLTGTNANVFYELAIRHVLRKPYVQICDVNTSLPFDVKDQRTIMFDYKDLDSVAEAKRLLIQYTKNAMTNPDGLMTPIHEGLVIEGLLSSEKSSDQVLGSLIENVLEISNQVQVITKYLGQDSKKLTIPNLNEKQKQNRNYLALRKHIVQGACVEGSIIHHEDYGIGKVLQITDKFNLLVEFPEINEQKVVRAGIDPAKLIFEFNFNEVSAST